jgi:hypothetical protein
MTKEKKSNNRVKLREKVDELVSGKGISDVEKKRDKFEQKQADKSQQKISEEEKEELVNRIKQGITYSTSGKDFLLFILLQLIPLSLLAAALLIPGVILWYRYYDLYIIILFILSGLTIFYGLIRLFATLTYKIEIKSDQIRWRNIFWWNTIKKQPVSEIQVINSYYFYLIKIRGILRITVEIVKLVSEDKTYWIRMYPLRKNKADRLVLIIKCWAWMDKKEKSDEI